MVRINTCPTSHKSLLLFFLQDIMPGTNAGMERNILESPWTLALDIY